jgi:hypothetical protein
MFQTTGMTGANLNNQRAQKVLFYIPLGWRFVHTFDTTVAKVVKHLGGDIKLVSCDGLFPQCDMVWPWYGRRTVDTCTGCRAETKKTLDSTGLNYQFLGEWLTQDDKQEINLWLNSLDDSCNLTEVLFDQLPIGKWVESSVHSHVLEDEIDHGSAYTRTAYKQYLYGGAITIRGSQRLFKEWQPDALFTMGGRFFSHRVVLEIAKIHGTRVFAWERGFTEETFGIWEDCNCHSGKPFSNLYNLTRNSALTETQYQQVSEIFEKRRSGKATNWYSFVQESDGFKSLAQKLNQRGYKKGSTIITFFTSSGFEMTSELEYWGVCSQYQVIKEAIEFYSSLPNCTFVIRIHPNARWNQARDINKIFEECGSPRNVLVINDIEGINSYELLALTDKVITFCSTIALEACAISKPVLVSGYGYYHGYDFTLSITDNKPIKQFFEDLLSFEMTKAQYYDSLKFSYHYFFSFSFAVPEVKFHGLHDMLPNYSSDQQLFTDTSKPLKLLAKSILDGESFYDRLISDSDFVDNLFNKDIKEKLENRAAFDNLAENSDVTRIANVHFYEQNLAAKQILSSLKLSEKLMIDGSQNIKESLTEINQFAHNTDAVLLLFTSESDSDSERIHECNKLISSDPSLDLVYFAKNSANININEQSLFENGIEFPFIIRSSAFKKIGGLDPELSSQSLWLLGIRFVLNGFKFVAINSNQAGTTIPSYFDRLSQAARWEHLNSVRETLTPESVINFFRRLGRSAVTEDERIDILTYCSGLALKRIQSGSAIAFPQAILEWLKYALSLDQNRLSTINILVSALHILGAVDAAREIVNQIPDHLCSQDVLINKKIINGQSSAQLII